MAQNYAQFFQTAKETAYDSNTLPLMRLSALNQAVNFQVLPAPGQTANTANQMVVHRLNRIKAIASPVQDQNDGLGSNMVAKLDAASRLTWDSLGTKRAALQQIAIVIPKNAELDLDNLDDAYGKSVADMTTNTMIAGEEAALQNVWDGAGNTTVTKIAAPTDDASRETLRDTIAQTIEQIQLKVDDFKAYSDKVVVLIHPTLARAFETLHGVTYYQAPDTFTNGASSKRFVFNGVTFYVHNLLNAIAGAAATEVGGAIILDSEAYANSGLGIAGEITPLDFQFAGDRVIGHQYAYLDLVIDPTRIVKFELTLPTGLTASAKVND